MPDWSHLLDPYRERSVFSSADGQELLAAALGEDSLVAAVDYYLQSNDPAVEALRYLFKLVKPQLATARCLELLWAAGAPQDQCEKAADLLQVTGRPCDLVAVEALLNDDHVTRQQAARRVLFQLMWSVDCDSEQISRMVRRCIEIGAHRDGLQLAVHALQEIVDADPWEERGTRLTVDEITTMFACALTSGDSRRVEAGLDHCPDDLIPGLTEQLDSIVASGDAGLAEAARELLDRRAPGPSGEPSKTNDPGWRTTRD